MTPMTVRAGQLQMGDTRRAGGESKKMGDRKPSLPQVQGGAGPVGRPQFLYVELNRRCTLKCDHCDFWTGRRKIALSDEQLAKAIAEFAELGGQTVVTCGGEASLEGERFWLLHRLAREHGLGSFSVTNGTRVTPKNVYRWLAEGPSEVTVSIDSHDPDKHDKWRGRANWHVAMRALELLLAYRRGTTRVYAMTIVAERNYRELPELYELILGDLGADKLKLNMAQPVFGWRKNDQWFPENAIRDPAHLLSVIGECDANWGIRRNPAWKADVLDYWQAVSRGQDIRRMGSTRTNRQLCNSSERNLWINWKGVITLCPASYFGATHFKAKGDLRRAWESQPRDEMRSCKRLCGISHSVRKSTSLEVA